MTKYQRDRLRVWHVVVRADGQKFWCATSLRWFHTRRECQDYIDHFRSEAPTIYDGMEHKPMCYYPTVLA